jgi:hypothetical protein
MALLPQRNNRTSARPADDLGKCYINLGSSWKGQRHDNSICFIRCPHLENSASNKEDTKLALDTKTIKELKRLIATAERLIDANSRSNGKSAAVTTKRAKKRTRRTGKDLVQFRKMLKAERRKGISVAALARKHGISTAYIYQL